MQKPAFNWREREAELVALLAAYLTPAQAVSALEQWEALLTARPELSERHSQDLEIRDPR